MTNAFAHFIQRTRLPVRLRRCQPVGAIAILHRFRHIHLCLNKRLHRGIVQTQLTRFRQGFVQHLALLTQIFNRLMMLRFITRHILHVRQARVNKLARQRTAEFCRGGGTAANQQR